VRRLESARLRRLVDVLEQIYSVQDLDAFSAVVPLAVQKLVSAHTIVLTEVNPRLGRARWVLAPSDAPVARFQDAFERHMQEDPIVAWFAQATGGQAMRMSDVVTRSDFHRRGVYNEVYRPSGIEYQVAFAIATPQPLMLGVTVNRDRRDFTEGDRALLDVLRPHLIQAYRNAEVLMNVQGQVALLIRGAEELGQALALVGSNGTVLGQTAVARDFLGYYFAWPRRRASAELPEPLTSWVRDQLSRRVDKLLTPRAPFVTERDGSLLVVRLLEARGQTLLVFEERRTAPVSWRDVAPLGLTRREAEVLSWVAEGKTNSEIAIILGLSVATVRHHVERILQKLGVETRTAAAALALQSTRRTATHR